MGREAVVRERKRASARTWTFCVAWTGDDKEEWSSLTDEVGTRSECKTAEPIQK